MEFEYMQMLAKKDAQAAGRKEGLEEGRKEGLEEGRKEGLEEGRKESHLQIYASLVQDGILSLSDAVKRSRLSEAELKEAISK